MVKAQRPTAPGNRFANDQFRIDLAAGTVTCPATVTTRSCPPPAVGPGSVRRCLQRLPAPQRLHQRRSRWDGRHPPARGRPGCRPHPPTRPRVAGRQSGDPAEGPAQARPPAAPSPRRPARPHAGLERVAQDFKLLPPRSTWPASPASVELHQQQLAGPAGLTGNRTTQSCAPAQHAEPLQPVREHHPPRKRERCMPLLPRRQISSTPPAARLGGRAA